MKNYLFALITFIFSVYSVYSQVPDAFSYQAVVRNSSGEVVDNQDVNFRISILQDSESGTAVYVETHSATTNDFGLANLKIGKGTVVGGTFSPAGWGAAPHFLKVEIDPDGGSSFIEMGTTQLLSVPYAFHAQTVENDEVDDADADATNEIQTLSISGTQLTLSDGGGTVELPSSGGGDNWGTQTVVSDATLDGEGTSANPLTVVGDLTDDQTLSISGNDLSILDGNTVTLPTSSSPWESSTAGIKYYWGKVGINHDPADDSGALQIWGEDGISLEVVSSSAAFPTIYAQNNSGTAAYIDGNLVIDNGTQGAGKVLTSDANGMASWQNSSSSLWFQNGSEIYYDGNVGIGTSDPMFKLDIVDDATDNYARLQSGAGSAMFFLERAGSSDASAIGYKTGGANYFYTGLLSSSSYKITTQNPTLNGLEVEIDGDVNLSDELHSSAEGSSNMMPFAYGYITSTGTNSSSTSNVGTITKNGTGQYKIEIAGLGTDFIAIITPNQGLSYLTGTVIGRNSAYFTVAIWDTKNDAYADGGFSFLIYKP